MEDQTKSNQNCGCDDGCCTPKKKKPLWSKLVFIAIILAAATIITVKMVGKNDTPSVKTNDTVITNSAGVTDTVKKESCSKTCSPTVSSSCCSKSNNN